jgi:ATP-binding cassette subfamily C protein
MATKNPSFVLWPMIRPVITTVAVFSFASNLLLFVVPLYMLQVYDRIIVTRNENTLVALSGVALLVLVVFVALEALRTRILVRFGLMFDAHVSGEIFKAAHASHMAQPRQAGGQLIRDIDVFRDFITGSGLLALCDAPWFPVFVAAAFLLHPLYGWVALIGSVIIVTLTLCNEMLTRRPLRAAGIASNSASQRAQSALRHAEVAQSMGMVAALRGSWKQHRDDQLLHQAGASDRAGVLVAATRGARLLLQVGILGTGAYLAIERQASAGSIVAASILISRALQPVEILLGQWRSFMAARLALGRIRAALASGTTGPARMVYPAPVGTISLEAVTVRPPGGERATLHSISFDVRPGEVLAVVGASAAGKSTLLRAMIGLWPLEFGVVRLDGHDIASWDVADFGRHVGYLPQTVDLFMGTVAENIARFQEVDIGRVIATARDAGCHEMIQALPKGYNTEIADGGGGLSGGQRQRIGLARALYGDPRVVLLDEPDAHLDREGEGLLAGVIALQRKRRATTIIVTHTPSLLAVADRILYLRDGRVESLGARKEMILPQVVPGPRTL